MNLLCPKQDSRLPVAPRSTYNEQKCNSNRKITPVLMNDCLLCNQSALRINQRGEREKWWKQQRNSLEFKSELNYS